MLKFFRRLLNAFTDSFALATKLEYEADARLLVARALADHEPYPREWE